MMKDKDQKLIWEARWGHGRPRAGAKHQTSAELDKDSPGEGIRVKDVVDSSEEETYEERGQRGEGRGLLKALSSWIETARGDQLKGAYESILKAYQIAGYPEPGGAEEIERDDDYRGEDPSPRETDQDRYGYQGDR